MVEFIHSLTGSKMLVADDRVEEYKAAGHKLAADVSAQSQATESVSESESTSESESESLSTSESESESEEIKSETADDGKKAKTKKSSDK